MGLVAALLSHLGWRPHADRAHSATAALPFARPVAPRSAPRSAPVAPPSVIEPTDERALLRQSLQAGILDPRFQLLDLDDAFIDEIGRQLVRSRDEIALPPAAVFDVVQMIDHPGYPVRKVAAAIACDPTLAGAVLSRANSPLHRGALPVENVATSVVRLGQRHLRLLLMEIALHSTRVRGRPFEAFSTTLWKHSLLTAQLGRQLAPLAGVDAEHAYMAGLFHDIGCFAALAAARRLALRRERRPSSQTLRATLARYGYELNAAIVARWRLPTVVAGAVAHFREPVRAGEAATLAAVTALANDLSRPLGAWVAQRDVDFTHHPTVVRLGLDPNRLPRASVILELAQKIERVGRLQ